MGKKVKKSSGIEKVLNTWAIVLIIWSFYRAYFKTDLPIWFDEFIAKPVVFLLPVYYFIRKFEKRDFFEAIDLRFKTAGREVLVGLVIGLIFFAAIALGNIRQSSIEFLSFITSIFKVTTFYLLLISFATSISEEILSRGFVLKRLYENSKNIYASSFFASILFFFLHIPILFTRADISGNLLLQVMVIDLLFSFAVSILFIERKNLIVPVFVHAFYSLSLYLLI